MTRWKAAGIHLTASIVVGSLAASVIFGLWYPPPFSRAAGADKLALTLLGVDAVLGPVLTLIVYRQGKWGMRFDLACIATLQSLAFAYGISVIAEARPAFIVGAIDRFIIVSASQIEPADLAAAHDEAFRHIPWTGPRLVNALRPDDQHERSELLFSGLDGKDIERFPKYYVDYDTNAAPLLARALPLDLLDKRPGARELIDSWLHRHGRVARDVRWVPLVGRGGDMTLLLDGVTGKVLDTLAISPW